MKPSSPAMNTGSPLIIRPLFGAGVSRFRLVGQSLFLEQGGAVFRVIPASLMKPNALRKGLLFARLRLDTEQGPLVLGRLRKREARAVLKALRGRWLVRITPDITASAFAVRAMLGRGYPSQYRIALAQEKAAAAVQRFGQVPDRGGIDGPVRLSMFRYLQHIARLNDKQRALLQERFVDRKVFRYRDFFDRVERMPLTPRQREACVMDEENNLVLAGAGTGKTSVMIGRAGYLIQSGQARAPDILMLAFGNRAAAEMQARADSRLGNLGVTARTFHGLGQDIIGAVEGRKPSVSPLVSENDTHRLAYKVNEWLESHLADPRYRAAVNRYFRYYMYPEINPFDFETEGEYLDSLRANNLRTLKGEQVKSLGECFIANYLFCQGIEYQYEADYQHPTATVFHRQYQPDFYLPDQDLYIEFYGIDRQGNTPPFMSRDKYHEGINWKRQLHSEKGTTLIELYHYQRQEGTLERALEGALAEHEVVSDPLPGTAILETLREFGEVSQLAALMKDLLLRYRANGYEPDRHEPELQGADSMQLRSALKLLRPILRDYREHLEEQGHIDFDDMIGKAIRYVREGHYRSPWRYIMVDEFQDISEPRARLLSALKQSCPGCSLFCVGDDWQSIYRFTGSDLRYTIRFEETFGPTRTVKLDQTFRFNNRIGEVASRFVLRNPGQIDKDLRSVREVDQPAVSLLRQTAHRNQSDVRLEKVLERISARAEEGSSVYLLARYRHSLPDDHEIRRLKTLFPQLLTKSGTIHGAKGLEADYVVVLGLESGEYGMPSRKTGHPLLEALLPTPEAYPHAEERRLFYVALTRARHRVYLIADMTTASEFVVELLNDAYSLELNEFDTSLAQQLFQMLKCIRCKTGAMIPRKGQYGSFYGCNKYPLCSHTEPGCPACESPMYREDRFRVCVSPDCSTWVPVCPQCGADMKQRHGPFGTFWGCSNYRRSGPSCSHSEQTIDFHPVSMSLAVAQDQ